MKKPKPIYICPVCTCVKHTPLSMKRHLSGEHGKDVANVEQYAAEASFTPSH